MSISVGLEGVRADKRLLIVPAPFFLSPFVTAAIPRLFLALIAIALGVPAWRQGVAWRTLVPKDIQPFAAASFAAFFGIAAFAWSIWQTWFMCAIGLLILYVSLAARAPREDESRKPATAH